MHCASCDWKIIARYFTCDHEEYTDNVYCAKCFDDHPCALGDHGEGCATEIWDDELK